MCNKCNDYYGPNFPEGNECYLCPTNCKRCIKFPAKTQCLECDKYFSLNPYTLECYNCTKLGKFINLLIFSMIIIT